MYEDLVEDIGVHYTSPFGRTTLIAAAASGQTMMIGHLLQEGVDIHGCDGDGRSALWWACRHGHDQAGAWTGDSPCFLAISLREAVVIAAALLDCKADIDTRDDDGRTPLATAVRHAHEGGKSFPLPCFL